MNTIPALTEQKIRTFVGEQNVLKGQQGARDGAIVNPEQTDGNSGCEHAAALLLTRHSRLSTLKEELAAAGL